MSIKSIIMMQFYRKIMNSIHICGCFNMYFHAPHFPPYMVVKKEKFHTSLPHQPTHCKKTFLYSKKFTFAHPTQPVILSGANIPVGCLRSRTFQNLLQIADFEKPCCHRCLGIYPIVNTLQNIVLQPIGCVFRNYQFLFR